MITPAKAYSLFQSYREPVSVLALSVFVQFALPIMCFYWVFGWLYHLIFEAEYNTIVLAVLTVAFYSFLFFFFVLPAPEKKKDDKKKDDEKETRGIFYYSVPSKKYYLLLRDTIAAGLLQNLTQIDMSDILRITTVVNTGEFPFLPSDKKITVVERYVTIDLGEEAEKNRFEVGKNPQKKEYVIIKEGKITCEALPAHIWVSQTMDDGDFKKFVKIIVDQFLQDHFQKTTNYEEAIASSKELDAKFKAWLQAEVASGSLEDPETDYGYKIEIEVAKIDRPKTNNDAADNLKAFQDAANAVLALGNDGNRVPIERAAEMAIRLTAKNATTVNINDGGSGGGSKKKKGGRPNVAV